MRWCRSGRWISWYELIDEIYIGPCELETLGYTNFWSQPISRGRDDPIEFAGDPSTLLPTDNPSMEGGAYVTTGDCGKLLLMHLRDGTCGDTQVLTPESLARAHEDRIGPVYDGVAFQPKWGDGMGWFVDREEGYVSDGGSFGSQAWLDLDDGYGVYIVIEATSALGNELAAQLFGVVDEAVNAG